MYCGVGDVKGETLLPLLRQIEAAFPEDRGAAFFGEHIRRAQDYVDAVLCRGFLVPFQEPPHPVIQTATAKLACFYAMARFSEREDVAKDKRDAALEMLDALLEAGRLPGETPQAGTESWVRSGSLPEVFTQERLSRW